MGSTVLGKILQGLVHVQHGVGEEQEQLSLGFQTKVSREHLLVHTLERASQFYPHTLYVISRYSCCSVPLELKSAEPFLVTNRFMVKALRLQSAVPFPFISIHG